MKEIKLINLELENFKGARNRSIQFSEITEITGENETGKSTIFDSITWLLFNKDSQDKSNFDIKPLNKDGTVKHGLESRVRAEFEVDGSPIILEKIFKEKWTKKHGQAEKEFSGHETIYSINDIPMKKKDYEDEIKNLCDEKLFKLITNPNFFATLPWKEQRELIQKVTGTVSDETIINANEKLKVLQGAYTDSVENYMARTKATIKKLNEKLKEIPFRIDELEKQKENVNIEDLEDNRERLTKEISKIDEVLEDSVKGNEILIEHKQRYYDLKNEYQEKVNRAKMLSQKPLDKLNKELYEKTFEVQAAAHEFEKYEREIENNKRDLVIKTEKNKELEKQLENLRQEYLKINNTEFKLNKADTECPTCHKVLDNTQEIYEELKNQFNLNKADKLKQVINTANEYKKAIKNNKQKIDEINNKIISFTEKSETSLVEVKKVDEVIEELKEKIKIFKIDDAIEFEGKEELELEIKLTEKDINEFKLDSNLEIKEKKKNLVNDLEKINKKIALHENNKKIDERTEELQESEREIANKIVKAEGQLFLCEEFIKTKVELNESFINKKFKNIKFKLFNELINGGLEECCEMLIEGVPYRSVNTGTKIIAGLEVIDVLNEYVGVRAPIFLDNAESITSNVKVHSQLISLRAVEGVKELTIKGE